MPAQPFLRPNWEKTAGEDLTLNQSPGGSSRKARSVADGLGAEVITAPVLDGGGRGATTNLVQRNLGLQFHCTDAGQEVAARHHIRQRSAKVLAAHAKDFPKVNTLIVDEVFGGCRKAQKEHFDDGGLHDQLIAAAKAR